MVDYLDRGRSVLGHFNPEKGDFLDVRFFIGETTNIAIRNGVADQTSSQANVGAALRALINGAWGFSTTTSFGEDALLDAMWTAVNMAKAMARSIGEPGVVPEEYVYEGNVPLKVASDPREVAMEEKIRVAVELDEHIRGVSDRFKVSTASLSDTVRREVIVNSLGTEVDVSNCYISVRGNATAREGPLIQNAGESVGSTWGWETVEEVDTAEMGALVGKRAVALLGAERPPSGRLDIVMDPSLVGLFIHEAFGHAMEADARGTCRC
jgi:TldD protein